MVKSKAFVDTTILADVLTKKGIERKEAKAALAKYEETELPEYAIKEFKAGVLDYIKYLYNKLLETKSVGLTLIVLNKNVLQINRRATAVRVLGELLNEFETFKPSAELKKQYGDVAEDEVTMLDSIKIETKTLLYKAWLDRNSVTTRVVDNLPCYVQTGPYEKKDGTLSLQPNKCQTDKCCLAEEMSKNRFDLTKLIVTIDSLPKALKEKKENIKRKALLREIGSRPGVKISDKDCRNLGDAIFALFCPSDADILTTNVKDHKPLAEKLGKTAVSPKEILK